MDTLNIVSLNVKGLNTPEKRRMLLHDFHRMKADVVLLQETHFRDNSVPVLKNILYPTVYHSTYARAKSRGVSILVSARVPWSYEDIHLDGEGRYLFLRGRVGAEQVTFANLYAPNDHQDRWLKRAMERLTCFATVRGIRRRIPQMAPPQFHGRPAGAFLRHYTPHN